MFCEEDCELPISWRENEETLRPQNTDTHRDDKHPAEAVYPRQIKPDTLMLVQIKPDTLMLVQIK